MTEKREAKRHQLLFHTRVYDVDTRQSLGLLWDLSAKGLLVASEAPLRVGDRYRVRIPLPAPVQGQLELRTESEVIWTQQADHPGYYRNGLSASGVDDEQRKVLASLIKDYELRFAK